METLSFKQCFSSKFPSGGRGEWSEASRLLHCFRRRPSPRGKQNWAGLCACVWMSSYLFPHSTCFGSALAAFSPPRLHQAQNTTPAWSWALLRHVTASLPGIQQTSKFPEVGNWPEMTELCVLPDNRETMPPLPAVLGRTPIPGLLLIWATFQWKA